MSCEKATQFEKVETVALRAYFLGRSLLNFESCVNSCDDSGLGGNSRCVACVRQCKKRLQTEREVIQRILLDQHSKQESL